MGPKHHSRNCATLPYGVLHHLCKVGHDPTAEIRGLKCQELELAQGYTALLTCSSRTQPQICLTAGLIASLASQGPGHSEASILENSPALAIHPSDNKESPQAIANRFVSPQNVFH